MKKIVIASVALALGGFFGSAVAGDAAAGKAKYAACAGCHMPNGAGNPPTYPALKGKDAAYITEQLNAFKSGARQNPIMAPMAAPLTDADIANLAAYIATLK